MNIIFLILFFIIGGVIIGGLVAWLLTRVKTGGVGDDRGMLMMQEQLKEIRSTLDAKLSESTKNTSEAIHRQFGESAKIIRDVTERLTKLDETNKQVVNFADQLKN